MFYRSVNIIIVGAVMSFIATAAIVLRFWARRMGNAAYGADDYLAVAGLVLTLAISSTCIVGAADAGIGAHETLGPDGFPDAERAIKYGKIFYVSQILHTVAMPAIRISLLLFYRRLFGQSKGFKIAVTAVGAFVLAWFIAVLFATIFQCGTSIESNWATTPEGYAACIKNPYDFYAAAALTNALSDVAIIVIPFPLVLKLQMAAYHKIAILGYIATGSLVIVAGIGRTVSYFTTNPYSNDWSYETYLWWIWGQIEPAFGVVGICLPLMRPLFRKVVPTKISTAAKSYLGASRNGSRNHAGGLASAPHASNAFGTVAQPYDRLDDKSEAKLSDDRMSAIEMANTYPERQPVHPLPAHISRVRPSLQ